MAVEMNFYLSDSDFRKLQLLKKTEERDNLTFNEYAERLLSSTISTIYREYDRRGQIRKEDE